MVRILEAMIYDLIIVSMSNTKSLIQITENCIESAMLDDAEMNIIVVETGQYLYKYKNANKIVLYKGEFNYNHALNMGLQKAIGDVHVLANNDIVFHKGWSKIGEQMKINGFDSASALSSDYRQNLLKRGDWVYEGYQIGLHITGWCIFATKECIKKIGKLDESVNFWYSDNIYADQLIKQKLRHGVFCNVQVDHITSSTLRLMPGRIQRQYSYGSQSLYRAASKLLKNA